MDFESDEMFKVLKFKMNDWANTARLVQAASAVAKPAAAGMATPAKGGDKKKAAAPAKVGGAGEEKKESAPVFVDTTPKGQKKDMSQPMANEYIPKQVEAAWYSWW